SVLFLIIKLIFNDEGQIGYQILLMSFTGGLSITENINQITIMTGKPPSKTIKQHIVRPKHDSN
ncbi:hypothetical protein NPS74_24115, partial [Cutibacterium acnes subsp. acnes]|nr:hypothetical protein [Cutibacterium acnes subsp. acnes]